MVIWTVIGAMHARKLLIFTQKSKKIIASNPISGEEEFAIHDYENFGDMSIDEYTSLETVSAIAEFVVQYDGLGAAVFEYTNGNIDEAQ